MAYDEGLLALMQDDLADTTGIVEKRMFGGLCFMKDGHMLCGVHKNGAVYRVGKAREAQALALPGARPMDFTGRVMAGFVDIDADGMADDGNRRAWLTLALQNVAALPPKDA